MILTKVQKILSFNFVDHVEANAEDIWMIEFGVHVICLIFIETISYVKI
jgi:hypothetical protein